MAIIYALCCLACTALNDFVFKIFADKRKSCGLFVTIVGIVWFAFLVVLPRNYDHLAVTLLWGCISGFLSLTSNVMLIEAMKFLSAGISSTIFRLNMVIVAIAAILFLHEPMTWLLAAGIACALLAIIAFIPRKADSASTDKSQQKGFIIAVIAAILRAAMSLSYKVGFAQGADVNSVSVIDAWFWIIGGILYAAFVEHSLRRPDKGEITIGAVSGLFVGGIIFFMARMNACGDASVVNPIAQMSFLGTCILSVVFLKEKLTPQKLFALICGAAAVICLACN